MEFEKSTFLLLQEAACSRVRNTQLNVLLLTEGEHRGKAVPSFPESLKLHVGGAAYMSRIPGMETDGCRG